MFQVFLIFFLSSFCFAQNMDQSQVSSDPSQVPTDLINLLKEDKTDEHLYVAGKYYCHNFASTLYLERSSLVSAMDAFDLEGIKIDWGIVVTRLAETSKMPIYYVSLANSESGFYHAINAVLVNPKKPEDINSYIFIEPQTDETFITASLLYDRYRKYYDKSPDEEVLVVSISTISKIKQAEHGTAFQTWNDRLYAFDVKFK